MSFDYRTPPLKDGELDVLAGYVDLCVPPTVALDIGVIRRLLMSSQAYLNAEGDLERLRIDEATWTELRTHVMTIADESAKNRLLTLLSAALFISNPPERRVFAGEGNPVTPVDFTRDSLYETVRGEDLIGAGVLGAELEQRIAEGARDPIKGRWDVVVADERDRERSQWTAEQARDAALAAAKARTPRPAHFPQDPTNPVCSVCVCGLPWPHSL